MASPVPKNVAAVLGLVPTVLGGVRRLPAKAVQLPVIAIGSALSSIDVARREYDDLADRGERLIARLRGTSFDEVESAFGGMAERLNDSAAANAKTAAGSAQKQVQDQVEAEQAIQEMLPVEPPPAPAPAPARVDSAAAPEVVEQVEKIAANVHAAVITDHSELPLPDYDHMTLGSLRGRLRSLDMQQLVQLRDYEKSKADRLPVITMLDNRIAKLSNGESTPSGAVAPQPAAAKPPKKVGTTAAAKADSSPPHSKVRYT